MGLAPDIGHRGFALVVEGIEVLFEADVGRHSGVDGAAEPRLRSLRRHGIASSASVALQIRLDWRPTLSPKKRWPFQLVPVMALAIIDRLP